MSQLSLDHGGSARRRLMLTAAGAAAVTVSGCSALPYRDAPFTRYTPLAYRAQAPGGATLTLFGTLHVGLARFYPLPNPIEDSYRSARTLAVEIDTAARWDELVDGFAGAVQLRDGLTLDQLLGPEHTRELRSHFTIDDQDWTRLRRMQPWWVANFRLNTLADRSIGTRGEDGAERYFLRRGRADGKNLIELESPRDQIRGFSGGSLSEQTEQLITWYRSIRQDGGGMRRLIDAWRRGDAQRIETLKSLAWGDRANLATLRQRFFTERDWRMARRLVREAGALSPGESLFAAVGAFHLTGEDGIPARLRQLGLRVTRIAAPDGRV